MVTTALSETLVEHDASLVHAARDGSSHAASELFHRHAPVVRRVLTRTLGPFHDVDDHVQDTFAAFFERIATLRSDDAARAFLVSVAIRVARKELRRRRIRRILHLSPPEELAELAGAGAGGATNVEARDALRRLFDILDDLDAKSRIAFGLKYLEGMDLSEIAAAQGESVSSSKRRLARAAPVIAARIAHDPVLSAYVQGERS
jgi:RNA polymerase sigma-70 factor (ECF subfamily)